MILRRWEDLPPEMQTPEVRPYYDVLRAKRGSLLVKRVFDVTAAFVLILLLSPLFFALAVAIKVDSHGPVFYRQERVTQYGRRFYIHKFRSMVQDADKGYGVTVKDDTRITRVGRFIRRCRLDEISQLIDILQLNMSFVGTRPEIPKYVAAYTPEMLATLLLPAGVTSEASISYKNEAELLDAAEDVDRTYVGQVLPEKMKINLANIRSFSICQEFRVMFLTVKSVLYTTK